MGASVEDEDDFDDEEEGTFGGGAGDDGFDDGGLTTARRVNFETSPDTGEDSQEGPCDASE